MPALQLAHQQRPQPELEPAAAWLPWVGGVERINALARVERGARFRPRLKRRFERRYRKPDWR
jgi:uncharacterized SAM-binding protein YcdF (DUF218 family)